jgi:hypothetical protein
VAAGHCFSTVYEPEYRAETAYSALFPANFRPKNPTKGDGLHGRGFKVAELFYDAVPIQSIGAA